MPEIKEREERSEYIHMYVTKTTKAEFEAAKGNKELEETIIRGFIKSETNWMEDEMRAVDEATIKYKAKLIAMKDAFQEAQQTQINAVTKIYDEAGRKLSQMDSLFNGLESKAKSVYQEAGKVQKAMDYLNSDRLEKLLDVVDRWSKMGEDEKALIQSLIQSKS